MFFIDSVFENLPTCYSLFITSTSVIAVLLRSSSRHGHVQNGENFESFDMHITHEVEQSDILSSCFNSYTVNKGLFHIFVLFVVGFAV